MNGLNKYKEVLLAEADLFDLAKVGDVFSFQRNLKDKSTINFKNERGYSPLMIAAYNGHYALSKYLLTIGGDPNSIDESGGSIFMGVAFKGHKQIAQLLIDHGADINYKNQKSQTALDFAQMFGRTEIVKLIRLHQNRPESFSIFDSLKSWSSVFSLKG